MWEVVQVFRWRDALDVLLLSAVTPAGVELLQMDPPRVTVRVESS